MPNRSASTVDRRLLYAAAGAGAVLLGVLVLNMTSGGGDDSAGGVVPRPTTPAASTTTTTVALPDPSAEVAAALGRPLDPFNQIVTAAPAAPQSVAAAQPAQPTQAAPAAPASATSKVNSPSTTKATTTTTAAAAAASTTTTTQVAIAALNTPGNTAIPFSTSVMVAPAGVSGVPLNICVENATRACVVTPAPVTTVALLTSASLDPTAARPPTIVSGACSNGQGVAAVITSGSNGAVITGIVFATVNGSQVAFPVTAGATAPNQSVIISACVPPGVGVPIAPSATQSPLGGALATVSNAVVGLLGVLGANSGLLAARSPN